MPLPITSLLVFVMLVRATTWRNLQIAWAGSVQNFGDSFSVPEERLFGIPDSQKRVLRISGGSVSEEKARKTFKVVQVHVVHRHGDRTPITPLKNEEYWKSSLPKPDILDKIAETTKIMRDESIEPNNHAAGGRGAFGKLTQMGLFQMVELGNKLREELHADVDGEHHTDDEGNRFYNKNRLFHPQDPLHPSNVKVISTDFPRTIQSVQGLLVGLFPDGTDDDQPIEIDVRHTNLMIPDPQPRQTQEQVELEMALAESQHLKDKEKEMKDLAIRTTEALRHLLAEDAYDVSFGIGEEKDGESSTFTETLPWAQLSEITKCLQVRDLLPSSISEADQRAISSHAAWRWFENLRHPRLSFLAMNKMLSTMVNSMHRKKAQTEGDLQEGEHALHVYSAHDSTLIALICAYRLEQPAQWPEYGSYLKIELIEARTADKEDSMVEHFVRFSLNGQVLRSSWSTNENGEPEEMISLDELDEKICSDRGETA